VSLSFPMSGAVGAAVGNAVTRIGSGGLGGSCGDAEGTIDVPDIANHSTNMSAAAAITLNNSAITVTLRRPARWLTHIVRKPALCQRQTAV
jgi:hypothetical protein